MDEEKIIEQLTEVLKFAEKNDDNNTVIVLSALIGAKFSLDDGLLAKEVQKIVKDILLPRTQMGSRGINLN